MNRQTRARLQRLHALPAIQPPPPSHPLPTERFVDRADLFADGQVRDADIAPLLDGPVFQPLRDPTAFEQVFVDEETRTVAWPNGADLDPDVLYQAAPPATPHAARVSIPQHA